MVPVQTKANYTILLTEFHPATILPNRRKASVTGLAISSKYSVLAKPYKVVQNAWK